MAIERIETAEAPRAIGPYSQGIRAGDFVFFSGQIPIDPATGELVSGDIAEQARRVLENMDAALRAAGLGFDRVVKSTIFLTDLADFGTVNQLYGERFGETFPARSTVQVAALPKGAKIEIEWIAFGG